MKNQNPQDILNEILLRMRYDSSKTLSENIVVISEQQQTYRPVFNDPRKQIPQSDVLGPQGSFPRQLGVDKRSIEMAVQAKEKERKELEQAQLNAQVEKEYQKELSILKKKYKQGSMDSPQNFVPTNMDNYKKELGDYIESYNAYRAESTRLRPEYLKAKELLDKKYFKTKLTNFVSYDDGFNLPEKAKLSFFTKEDFHSVESIKNAFHTKISDNILKRFITEESTGPVITTPNYQFKSGDLFSWMWNKVKGKVKDFKLPEPYNIYVFNKNLYINNQGYFDVSKNYYFKNDEGKLILYNENDYRNSTFWENNGATLLNVGSLVISVLFPATWPYLLASATLDLAAAKIQYEQGETEGAKMSVLLSLTPFIPKLALKVPLIMTKNLINKFKGAVTADDVSKVVLKLSQEELKALGALKEYGDLNKLKREINYVEANNAINKVAKQAPSLVPALKKAGIELSLVTAIMASSWNDMTKELEENANKVQVLNNLFTNISKSNIFSEQQKEILKKRYTENYTEDKKDEFRKHINEKLKILEEKEKDIESQAEKEVDEDTKRYCEDFLKEIKKINTGVQDTLSLIEKKN